ncbi:MAG: hypothetical protein ACRDIY_04160, partial [Chloroflexota bacterium]
LGGQSTRQVADAMFSRLYQAKLQYFREHRGRRAARVYQVILVLAAWARLAAFRCAWLTGRSTDRKHRDLARCYRRLISDLPRF